MLQVVSSKIKRTARHSSRRVRKKDSCLSQNCQDVFNVFWDFEYEEPSKEIANFPVNSSISLIFRPN
ncbi:hypothetical protein B9Z55_016153 [Caenorhabditis nigoni]|uniref:Uncharacterized protein n=1 Tax=Caenorhabditis nigoni TaxID=1611254 RepID=A0A2G5UDH7_9PELO|nr:hypothetical protein B9Z55_016153 [Caenorhabditis nigoni]